MFLLIVKFVKNGASFRQAAKHVESVKEVSGDGAYIGCSEGLCARFIRAVAAANYQAIHDVLQNSWTFSIAIDCGNKLGVNYLDVRVRVYAAGDLQNLHILAIPFHERKTAANLFNLLERVLDILHPNWRNFIIGFTSDGEPTMTGHVGGVGVRFNQAATLPIYRFWCALHQLDLDIQAEYENYLNENFINQMNALIGYLRRQQNLHTQMGSICPRFVSTRWAGIEKVLTWLADNKVTVFNWLQQKQPACTPGSHWWVLMIALHKVAGEVLRVVKACQGMKTLISQQKARFLELKRRLEGLFPLEIDTEDLFFPIPDHVDTKNEIPIVCQGYKTNVSAVREFIGELGMFVDDRMSELEEGEISAVYDSVGKLVCGLVGRLTRLLVIPELNEHEVPPCTPQELVEMKRSEFSNLIRKNKPRLLEAGWGEENIDEIDDQMGLLREKYKNEVGFKAVIDSLNDHSNFQQSWTDPQLQNFGKLKTFCGGLATVMPTTAPVESDFSKIGFVKNDYRQSLTDFSLEGCLQCLQFEELNKVK